MAAVSVRELAGRPGLRRLAKRILRTPWVGAAVTTAWAPFGTLLLERAYRRASANRAPVRLQVGSGPNPLPGWLNTDLFSPLYLDATRRWE